jgi:cytochrome c
MKSIRLIVLACAILSTPALAGPAEDFNRGYRLAEMKGCFDCHTVDGKAVGPSFRAIAERYRADPAHRDRLPYIIRGGSAGHWGERFLMWPQARLSDQQLDELIAWILSQ